MSAPATSTGDAVSNRSRPLASRRRMMVVNGDRVVTVSNRSRPLASRRPRAKTINTNHSLKFPIDRVP